MSGWAEHTGLAVSLPIDDIDTDQLIPARFMSRPRSDGYGDYLLHDLRKSEQKTNPEGFILDRYPDASIVISGRNFGTGSSREAAVYALVDAGIKAVVATGFGDIFLANATNNALLAATVSQADHDKLVKYLDDSAATVEIDVPKRTLSTPGASFMFHLDDVQATKLVNGWDDIDLTQAYQDQIARYRCRRTVQSLWMWPDKSDSQ